MISHQNFIESLATIENYTEHYELIDSYVKQREISVLISLFNRTLETYSLAAQSPYTPRAIITRMVRSLSFAGNDVSAKTAIDLANIVNHVTTPSLVDMTQLISNIVSANSTDAIETLLQQIADTELRALILQEAVLRNKLSATSTVAQHTRVLLEKENHPLAVLPLTRLPLEEAFTLPALNLSGASYLLPFGPLNEKPDFSSMSLPASSLPLTDISLPEQKEMIGIAVQNWVQQSNGKVEVNIYQLNEVMVSQFGSALSTLPMDCFQLAQNGRYAKNKSATSILAMLFSASSTGGAYNRGMGSAYGRLQAWQSLAGLMGDNLSMPFPQLIDNAHVCQWVSFETDAWFYQIAWDVGIACLNPVTNRLAVLVASDTD